MLHIDLLKWVASGSLTSITGINLLVWSKELGSISKHDLSHRNNIMMKTKTRKKLIESFKALGIILYLFGTVLLTLSLEFYHSERGKTVETVEDATIQTREVVSQPDINEGLILGAISFGFVLIGMMELLRHYDENNKLSKYAAIIYTIGWLGASIAAATKYKSLNSFEFSRWYWTLPGAVGIIAGTLLLPLQINTNYSALPTWILLILGYTSYTIGNVKQS